MRVSRLVGAVVVVAGCGGGSGDGGTTPPTPVASVALLPSATATSICGNVTLTATPRDAQGNALSRTVEWGGSGTILDLSTATGATNTGTGIGVGTANITASSGGQTSTPVAIVVTATGAAPATQAVSAPPGTAFSPVCVELAPGGTVTWTFGTEDHNVQFSGPQPTGGNISNTRSASVPRTFPSAGNYEYACSLHAGMIGRVVVR
jgi:plastocyanin